MLKKNMHHLILFNQLFWENIWNHGKNLQDLRYQNH